MNTTNPQKLYTDLMAAIEQAKLALEKDRPKKLRYVLKYSSLYRGKVIPQGMSGKTLEKYLPNQGFIGHVTQNRTFVQAVRSDKQILSQVKELKNGFTRIIHR